MIKQSRKSSASPLPSYITGADNIAENALQGVATGRKNWLLADSDNGGEHAAVLYLLTGTCRLNDVEPEKWQRYVIEHIQEGPTNRVRELLPWKVDLTEK